MANLNRSLVKVAGITVLAAALGLGTAFSAPPQRVTRPAGGAPRASTSRVAVAYSQPRFAGYGGFNGYYTPFFAAPLAPTPYLPKYWWTGYYPEADPCQAGTCNPDAGYTWDSVEALILSTEPKNAKVTLDGVFVGTTDRLGPFQLPAGEHTLRIEAEGFAPSEKVLNVESAHVEQLEIRLEPVAAFSPKPGPTR